MKSIELRPFSQQIRNPIRRTPPYLKQRKYFLGTDIGLSESHSNFLYNLADSKQKIFSNVLSVGDACATGISASLEYLQRNEIYAGSTNKDKQWKAT